MRPKVTYMFSVALRHVEHEGLPVRESLFSWSHVERACFERKQKDERACFKVWGRHGSLGQR